MISPTCGRLSAATSYGWADASNNRVFIAGVNNDGHGGWQGWSRNDEAAFKLDVGRKTLTMKHKQKTFQLTGLKGATTWYIHVNLFYKSSWVEIFPLQESGYEAF